LSAQLVRFALLKLNQQLIKPINALQDLTVKFLISGTNLNVYLVRLVSLVLQELIRCQTLQLSRFAQLNTSVPLVLQNLKISLRFMNLEVMSLENVRLATIVQQAL
jgi:hypothetical protein